MIGAGEEDRDIRALRSVVRGAVQRVSFRVLFRIGAPTWRVSSVADGLPKSVESRLPRVANGFLTTGAMSEGLSVFAISERQQNI